MAAAPAAMQAVVAKAAPAAPPAREGVQAAAAALAAVGAAGDPEGAHLAQLLQHQKDLKAQKRANASAIRNESRKKQRLVEKAKGLTTTELLEVVAVRAAVEAKAKAKATAKAKAAAAKAKAGPVLPPPLAGGVAVVPLLGDAAPPSPAAAP